MRTTIFLAMLLLPALASATPPDRKMTDEQIVQDLSAYLDKQAAGDKFSGAVLLAKGDQVLFKNAYGFANHAFNARNTVDTKFNLASMGKMFTGVATLQLAQQGKLALTDTVLKLAPGYPDEEIGAKINVHQLLTHTSGLGMLFTEEFGNASRAKYRTTSSLLRWATGEPLKFEPGTRYAYSNSGFVVLGLIIEKVSDQSYQDYVREHIFKPAGMINTDNYNVDDDIPNLALGYTMADDDGRPRSYGLRRSNILLHVARGSSAGGAFSTVEDLHRFSQALLGHKLLNKEYTDLDITGKVSTGFGTDKYAYGMNESTVNGVRIIGHNGGFPGINSFLDMYPDSGYTVAVLSNYDSGGQFIVERLRLLLTGQTPPEPIQLPAGALQVFAGTYDLSEAGRPPVVLTVDHDALVFRNGNGPHRFVPLSALEFFDEEVPKVRMKFAKDRRGRVTSVTFIGLSAEPIKGPRVAR